MHALPQFKFSSPHPPTPLQRNPSPPSTRFPFHGNSSGLRRSQKLERGPIPSKRLRKTERNVVAMSQIATAGSGSSNDDALFFEGRLSNLRVGARARGICFYAVTALTAIPLFVAMAVAHPFVMAFDRHKRRVHHLIAKIWATLTIAAFYRFEFEGLDNLPPRDGPAVYVSNHQSFLDTYTLLALGRSFKFISKTSIFVIPIVGWAMFLMGHIPLRRMDGRSQLVWLISVFVCIVTCFVY